MPDETEETQTEETPGTPAEAAHEAEITDEELGEVGEDLIDALHRLEQLHERVEMLESYFLAEDEEDGSEREHGAETAPETPGHAADRPPASVNRYWRRRDQR